MPIAPAARLPPALPLRNVGAVSGVALPPDTGCHSELASAMSDRGPRAPLIAAALSLLFPGLGQYLTGAQQRGMLVALPALVLSTAVLGFLIGTVAGGGPAAIVELLLRPEVLLAIIAVDLLVLAYHLVAVADAWLLARRVAAAAGRRTGRLAGAGLVAVLVVTTFAHGSVAALGMQTEDGLRAVFQDDPGGGWEIPESSFEPDPTPMPSRSMPASSSPSTTAMPATPSPTPAPTPTPSPAPAWAKDGRLDVLLVGSDAGTGRWMLRMDTMVVLSVDVATGRAAMFGIPRNMVNVPLPPESAGAFPNGRFPGMLNALYVYAWGHPSAFPGGDARGFRAVTGAVQQLVGVKLDGFVAVDLRGFVKLVNAFGGLWIRVPERLEDDRYPNVDGSGYSHIVIKAGCQKLNGAMALAYARSRHQDSDYGRMARQQAVLLALHRQLDPLDVLERAPELLSIAKDHLWTTVKRADLAGLAALAARVNVGKVEKVLFVPSKYPSVLTTAEIKQIRSVVRNVFRDEPAQGGGGSATGKACP